MQVSQDSDNIILALLALTIGATPVGTNLVVKIGHRTYNIGRLLAAMRMRNIDPVAFARLYALSGFNFNAACHIATARYMVRSYDAFKLFIGDISMEESVISLYYFAFLCNRFGSRTVQHMPKEFRRHLEVEILNGDTEVAAFSLPEKAKQSARRLIFLHKDSKLPAHLIPLDAYMRLAYARAVRFGITLYYAPAGNTHCLVGLPCDESVGAKEWGGQLLETNGNMEGCKVVIKDRDSGKLART